MRILIVGASGMLGTALLGEFVDANECIGLSRRRPDGALADWCEVDIEAKADFIATLGTVRPDVIVYAAAVTDVDYCERDAARALRVNQDAVGDVVDYCSAHHAKLIYVSTDSVFDGTRPGLYREDDVTRPLNVYARTKLGGELHALRARDAVVLRTNIFGWRPGAGNSFGEWVIGSLRSGTPLSMFSDVLYTPIATPLFASLVRRCVDSGISGLYHAGGSEMLSKYEFALKVAEAYGLSAEGIRPVSVTDKALTAMRPKNMALDCSKLAAALRFEIPGAEASIAAWKAVEPRPKETLPHG